MGLENIGQIYMWPIIMFYQVVMTFKKPEMTFKSSEY